MIQTDGQKHSNHSSSSSSSSLATKTSIWNDGFISRPNASSFPKSISSSWVAAWRRIAKHLQIALWVEVWALDHSNKQDKEPRINKQNFEREECSPWNLSHQTSRIKMEKVRLFKTISKGSFKISKKSSTDYRCKSATPYEPKRIDFNIIREIHKNWKR